MCSCCISINKLYNIEEPPGSPTPVSQPALAKDSTLFSLLKSGFDKHEEDNNIDFYYEHNVPKLLSREGPKASVGDLNGDGLDNI